MHDVWLVILLKFSYLYRYGDSQWRLINKEVKAQCFDCEKIFAHKLQFKTLK